MNCPYCGNAAEWVENSEVYGKLYGKSYMIWLCRPCGAYVGCHNNTKKPLGTMANAELRKLRVDAHAAIDGYWQSGFDQRKVVYARLKEVFGREIHIGESDEKQCRGIIAAAPTLFSRNR